MGNRGTTPSWDEEQIRMYGLFGHLSFTSRRIRSRQNQEKKERKELSQKLVSLLQAQIDKKSGT